MRFPWQKKQEIERYGYNAGLSLDDYFTYLTSQYPLFNTTNPKLPREEIDGTYTSFARRAYKANGVIFACMAIRMRLFSEARFQFRQLQKGRPGDLFGTPALGILESPGVNQTTGDMLARAIQDVDLCGNWFGLKRNGSIYRMPPDWVTIVLGSEGSEVDAEVAGYFYHPGGRSSGQEPEAFLADQVAHFAPNPDPEARYRGMSWLTPIVREIQSDQAMTEHKLAFFENGATINQAITLNVRPDQFESFVEKFKAAHEGAANAYKTLFLGQGADLTPIGANLEQIQFKVTQGGGETRIAAAAGVPPVIVGLSEGLDAATYSNYGQARRSLADGTMRPLWRNMAASLQTIVPAPQGSQLWYDDRDIAFLREDEKDAADIQQVKAISIKSLIEAGYEPDSVVNAVTSGDLSRLSHTGMTSVQLMPPGSQNGSTQPALPVSTN